MAVEARIAELSNRHAKLEQSLNDVLSHPSSDDSEIIQLKREKLRVKEEIERLRRVPS